jgi:hypothetical protein
VDKINERKNEREEKNEQNGKILRFFCLLSDIGEAKWQMLDLPVFPTV